MSLEFLVLNARDEALHQVSLEEDVHARWMALAAAAGDKRVQRILDFHGDAEFDGDEIGDLLASVASARAACGADARLAAFLDGLAELAAQARKMGAAVDVIAD